MRVEFEYDPYSGYRSFKAGITTALILQHQVVSLPPALRLPHYVL